MNTGARASTRGERRILDHELTPILIIGVLFLLAPLFFYPVFLMRVMCFAIFACAYNLVFGYGGLLAFGHAAFFGSAGYVTAHAMKHFGVTPEIAILLGTLAAAGVSAIIGALAIRRQALYFAMITLALGEIVYFYALQAPWTFGEDGIQSVPRGHLFGFIDLRDMNSMYFFVLALFLIAFAIIQRVIRSPFGQALQAIRENEPRAISLGYNTIRFKFLAFLISGTLSGLAGSIKAIIFQVATITDVYFQTSADVLLAVLIGGSGTLLGPVVGAAVLAFMQNYLASFGAWVMIVQGGIFILLILFLRAGIVGAVLRLLRIQ